jgi:hypothetical protein
MNRDNARGLAQLTGAVSSWKKWATVIGVVLLGATSLVAQVAGRQNRISQNLTAKPNVEISGTVHPLTAKSTDLGAVNSNMPLNSLTLHIRPSAAQKKEIASLLVSLQDRKSPQYHKWLTQAEYGAQFGLTGSDLSQLKSWITGQGFTVKHVSKSLNSITFSGKAWQVESAFHTQLHQYKLDGETHFANATALRVPAQFADVVMSVRGMDNFRPKPNAKQMSAHPDTAFGTSPGNFFLAPADWATIYNVDQIYASGFDGTGTHVAVVGQSYAPPSDIDNFRLAAGLPPTNLASVCISTAPSGTTPSPSCTDPVLGIRAGDLAEADIDIEWAGGIAQNATVDYIYTAADDPQDVFAALAYAIRDYTVVADGSLVPVISMSYDFGCEGSVNIPGSSQLDEFDALGLQAGLQGQTLVVAAGDSGAAGCDATFLSPFTASAGFNPAAGGLAVTVPADNPLYTAVGGTMFSGDLPDPTPFWDPATGLASQYIPESPWNETGPTGPLAAGGGGESTVTLFDPITGLPTLTLRYPLPPWQIDPNTTLPLIPGALGRLVPDVAFAAAAGHDGYLYCSSDANANPCDSLANFTSGTPTTAGGTSVATPSFAGLLTLLVQQYGPLGSINPTLYNIAFNDSFSPAAFNDIASGTNNIPCVSGTLGCVDAVGIGFTATAGFDQATGLGSVNGGGLAGELGLLGFPLTAASTTTLTATPSSVVFGSSVSLVATVSSPSGAPIGTVTLTTASGTLFSSTQPLTAGVANFIVSATTPNGLGVGSYSMIATYTPDPSSTFFASHGSSALTVTPAATTTTIAPPTAVALGGTTILIATVASTTSSEFATGTVTFQLGSTTLGTGTLTAGVATLSVTASLANGFVVGLNSITASYVGDANFAASTGNATLTVNLAVAPTVVLTPSATSITTADALTVTVAVNGTPTPTGSVILTGGGFTSGVTVLAAGGATINVPAGSLTVGTDTLTATYTPDLASSSLYIGATGTTSVTVTGPAKTTPPVVLLPSATSITTAEVLAVTVAVNGTPTPTGSVILAGGGFTSAAATLVAGSVTINVPAGSLAVGTDTLTATYTPDATSSTIYNPAANTTSITVTAPVLKTPTMVLTPTPTSITTAETLSVKIGVNGGPTPTGSVILAGGGFTSKPSILIGGFTTITVPAGVLAVGTDTLTAGYTPDAASSLIYNSTSGTTSITVTTPAAPTYTLVATPSSVHGSSTVALALTSTNYAGTVSFATSVTSTNGTASNVTASATSFTLTNGGTGTSTLTITASASAANHTPAVPWKSGGAVVFCAVLLGVPFSRRKRAVAVLLTAMAISLAGFLMACGGGGSKTPPPPAARTYTVTVTPTGSGTVTNPAAVTVTVTVP